MSRNSTLFSFHLLRPICVSECGCELIVVLISLASAEVTGGRERDQQGNEEENQMAEKESTFRWVRFSCAFTSTHSRQTVPSGREFNLQENEPSLTASFFGVCLLYKCSWLTYVIFMSSMCYNPRIRSISDWLGLLHHSGSLVRFGSYPDILHSGRLYILSQYSLSVRWIE